MKLVLIKSIFFLAFLQCASLYSQERFQGKVIDLWGNNLGYVTYRLLPQGIQHVTDSNGVFEIENKITEQVVFSRQGYQTRIVGFNELAALGNITLMVEETAIEEVKINTGYYTVKKENATGSMVRIDNELLNRNPSSNITERLEGITSGLQFDRRTDYGDSKMSPSLRMRGLGTINSNTQPLIILDDFPYEGNLDAINPNDIESVSILRDASAAAIWGAKAGNGVIVLTSKRGSKGDLPNVTFSSNISIGEAPDLFYDKKFLPSAATMEVEEILYGRDHYYFYDFVMIPDYVSLLNKRDSSKISIEQFEREKARLHESDIRDDAQKFLYRPEQVGRFYVGISGQGGRHTYRSSVGWEREGANIKGNSSGRTTITLFDQFKFNERLSIFSDVQLGFLRSTFNGYSLDQLAAGGGLLSPYTTFYREDGSLSSLNYQFNHDYMDSAEKEGLLDWTFNPISDMDRRHLQMNNNSLHLNVGADYSPLSGLNLSVKYRYAKQGDVNTNHYDRESYFARNLINSFTQADGTKVIPEGGVHDGSSVDRVFHNARVQLSYDDKIGEDHSLNIVVGSEISQQRLREFGAYRHYGYNRDNLSYVSSIDFGTSYPLRPTGAGFVPSSSYRERLITDRFISHYLNAIYRLKESHVLSASVRWDASNLFGVATNQRGVPLWSIGFSEDLLSFLKGKNTYLDVLRIRGSYGISGNVNNTISSLPTTRLEMFDFISGLPYATLTSAGNPSLRWEKLRTVNFGLDFALLGRRLQGTIDVYGKHGMDLIGPEYLDPTTGVISQDGSYVVDNRINYADLKTKGIDISLEGQLVRSDNFAWTANLLWSWTSNRVTNYKASKQATASSYVSSLQPREGYSKDALFAWPFSGLNSDNGQLLTPAGDQDYLGYYSAADFNDLHLMGVAFPPYQGSIRNSITFKRLDLSANVEWKHGFIFRISSIDYNRLFTTGATHVDYEHRWKEKGDELKTDIPALPETSNLYQDALYTGSSVLIEKGDFIRLSDISLNYSLNFGIKRRCQMRIFFQVRNVCILWRSNGKGIDPDGVSSRYPTPRNYTLGAQLDF